MFDADRPIVKIEQDLLNRATFAKYLARCMLDQNEPDNFVVGLYGGWGSGKSSLLNMVLEELDFAASNLLDEDKPIIIKFNVWSYSGQDQLIYNFFRRLSTTLRNVAYLQEAGRLAYLLDTYTSLFTGKTLPEPLPYKQLDDIPRWKPGDDLILIKKEINAILKKQNHKIIIMIDNISHLYAKEIKQIFQLVKSMGDYTNTIYLLAFDKDLVIRNLNHLDGSGGKEIVEKIVQLPFHVPAISAQDLEIIFNDRVQAILKTIPQDSWNTEYWSDVFNHSLKYFFKDCRDITRYVNILNFSYARVRDVVNPVDFFALTALEVFVPDIYFGVRDNKDLFTDLLDHVYVMDHDEIQKDKERCDEILSRDNYVSRDILLDLLTHLFPRIRRIYQPQLKFYHSESIARKLKRICSPDLFEVYFRLSLQTGQISKTEFKTLLSFSDDSMAFDHALTRLNQDERIEKFLDQLDSNILTTIPAKHIQAIVSALLDNGDLFPPGLSSILDLSTPQRLHHIIHQLLLRLPTAAERFDVLQQAIAKSTKSLYLLVHELQEQAREHQEESDTYLPSEFRSLTPEQLVSLRNLVINRIEYWAQTGRLAEHPYLIPILNAWHDWGNPADCQHFIESMVDTDRGLIAFLKASLQIPIKEAMTRYEKAHSWEFALQEMATLIPPKRLQEHAKILFENAYFEKLKEEEQLALMIFLDLMKVKTVKIIPKTTV